MDRQTRVAPRTLVQWVRHLLQLRPLPLLPLLPQPTLRDKVVEQAMEEAQEAQTMRNIKATAKARRLGKTMVKLELPDGRTLWVPTSQLPQP